MKIIKKITKKDLEEFIYDIDLNDSNLYKEVNSKDSIGIFQISGGTADKLCKEVKPTNFSHLTAINAMARPGPLENSYRLYLKGKRGKLPNYPKKMLELLNETYGTIIFQEQVLEIFSKLGGFSLDEAEIVRNLMKRLSKAEKKEEDLIAWNEVVRKFSEGCIKKGIKEEEAKKITNDIKAFSGYSFNKAHAVSYAYISIVTLYFSYYFRKYFYCSLLSYENLSKIFQFIPSIKKHKINIKPPDINKSKKDFSIEEDNILFGLNSIKRVGPAAIEKILEERKNGDFKDFFDFYKRTKGRAVTKAVIEQLIKIGSFNDIDLDIKKLLNIFSDFYKKYKNKKREPDMFYQESYEEYKYSPRPTFEELIEYEKDCLDDNFFNMKFSQEKVKEKLEPRKNIIIDFLDDLNEDPRKIPLLVKSVRKHIDKNNNEMLFVSCIDKNFNFITFPVFYSIYKELLNKIEKDEIYLFYLIRKENNILLYNDFKLKGIKKNILIEKIS